MVKSPEQYSQLPYERVVIEARAGKRWAQSFQGLELTYRPQPPGYEDCINTVTLPIEPPFA